MTETPPTLIEELAASVHAAMAGGDALTSEQIHRNCAAFQQRFGPLVLAGARGAELLQLMHGRTGGEDRCLMYWLEFKDDVEFSGNAFGRIAGGSALKFGLFQRQSDGAWVTGSSMQQRTLSEAEATELANHQRDELLKAVRVLDDFRAHGDFSDAGYQRLQKAIDDAAPALSRTAWAHKYLFLMNPDILDDYHSPRYQRFHLLKILQMPPDGLGIIDGQAPRYLCAGRYKALAAQINAPITSMNTVLNRRHGYVHHYWKIGTTAGSAGESQWEEMRDGGYVAIGWRDEVPDLSDTLQRDNARELIRDRLLPLYDKPGQAQRKAGEILNFAAEVADSEIVLATEGQRVLGVGRVRGPYSYNPDAEFPHLRPVEWLSLNTFQLPEPEGPRTTVYQLGRSAKNLLAIEQNIYGASRPQPASGVASPKPVAAADPFVTRVENVLMHKGQVILYGPPGTGKTYKATAAARQLAARHTYSKDFVDLSAAQKEALTARDGVVRMCTFHPGWGYEDFIEGLRPKTLDGQMIFELRDGLFKTLCSDARDNPTRRYYLIIDEINRGDLPRIFGELMTAIEIDKRDHAITLPFSNASFSVPRNVFIIGTMNTADRSISLLDAAFRRRFGFIELMPDTALLGRQSVGGLALGPWLAALNERLRLNLKRDARNLQIGHAYLMPHQPIRSVAELARVFRHEILPLLEEYCYEDIDALHAILGDALVDINRRRICEEVFQNDARFIQALTYEEMLSFDLSAEEDAISDTAAEGNDDAGSAEI